MTKVNLAQNDIRLIANATDSDALAGAATFTSDIVYVGGYSVVSGFAYSDVASATSPDGLVIEQAASEADFTLGTPPITESIFEIGAGETEENAFSVQVVAPFVRIRYVNGAGAQTTFRLYAVARILRGL